MRTAPERKVGNHAVPGQFAEMGFDLGIRQFRVRQSGPFSNEKDQKIARKGSRPLLEQRLGHPARKYNSDLAPDLFIRASLEQRATEITKMGYKDSKSTK